MSCAPLSGYVYFKKDFEFSNGEIGRKLFVVMCDSTLDDDYVLVARTTSQLKTPVEEACFNNQHPPCFCYPVHATDFKKDTWIVFDYIVEIDKKFFENLDRKLDLTIRQTRDLLLCAADSEYIENWIRDAFRDQAALLV